MKKYKKIKRSKNPTFIFIAIVSAVLILFGIIRINDNHYVGNGSVCIDAGHGGADVGAVSVDGNRYEKTDNLTLALEVKRILENNGITVVMTREDDTKTSLSERVDIANKSHCSLFVSIHRNSSENASGVEAWIEDNAGSVEKHFADKMVNKVSKSLNLPDRGVKNGYRDNTSGNYYVNSKTKMPSVLLEVGFITNDDDNKAIDNNLTMCAEAIAETICDSL